MLVRLRSVAGLRALTHHTAAPRGLNSVALKEFEGRNPSLGLSIEQPYNRGSLRFSCRSMGLTCVDGIQCMVLASLLDRSSTHVSRVVLDTCSGHTGKETVFFLGFSPLTSCRAGLRLRMDTTSSSQGFMPPTKPPTIHLVRTLCHGCVAQSAEANHQDGEVGFNTHCHVDSSNVGLLFGDSMKEIR